MLTKPKTTHQSFLTKLLVTSSLLVPAGGFAWAHDQDDNRTLDTVMVTAQKRDQTAQEVPISISAYSGEELFRLGVKDFRSLGTFEPGVDIKSFDGDQNQIVTIRGIGTRSAEPTVSPSAGVHVNEIFQATPVFLSFPIFDVERVEVLKGPQGTLFGRNTTAGAVNIITNKPTEEFGGYVTGSYGSFNEIDLEGAVSGSIAPTLSGRLAAKYVKSDGHQVNLGTVERAGFSRDPAIPGIPNVGRDDNWGGANKFALRGTLDWNASSTVDVIASLHYLRDESEVWQYKLAGGEVADSTGFIPSSFDPFEIYSNREPELDMDQFGGHLRVDWDLGFASFVSLTGYETVDRAFFVDDGTPVRALEQDVKNDSSLFSHEFRLSSNEDDPLFWSVGVNYSWDKAELDKANPAYEFTPALPGIQTANIYERTAEAAAIFGQLEYQLNDQIRLIGGLRYLDETRELDESALNEDPFGLTPTEIFDLPFTVNREIQEDALVWKAGVNWTPSDSVLIYASVSDGFKSGGFDGTTPLFITDTIPFESETLMAYEAGIKTQWDAANLILNAAAFFYDYEDFQGTATVFVDVGGVAVQNNIVTNAGAAEVTGFEASATWAPTSALTFNGGFSVLDTEITEFNDIDPDVVAATVGNQLPDAPELSVSGSVRYEAPFGASNNTLGGQLDFAHVSDTFRDINNTEALAIDSYSLVNGRVDFGPEAQGWRVGVWVRNLADEEYATSKLSNLNSAALSPRVLFGLPRTYGIDLSVNF